MCDTRFRRPRVGPLTQARELTGPRQDTELPDKPFQALDRQLALGLQCGKLGAHDQELVAQPFLHARKLSPRTAGLLARTHPVLVGDRHTRDEPLHVRQVHIGLRLRSDCAER